MSSEGHDSDSVRREDCFVTTRWTLVVSAGRNSSAHAERALGELCETYWFPLYAYVRRRGYTKEDAEDLTQAFFARFLKKNYLKDLSAERGKFRAFLLASLKHFLANEWDKGSRQKRGGGMQPFSLDWASADQKFRLDPADHSSPDRIFDREWALAILERVVTRLRADSVAQGKAALFEQAKGCLMINAQAIPYARAAAELGMEEGALRVAVHRLRKRYREILHEEILQTLADPAQVPEEIRSLQAALADS